MKRKNILLCALCAVLLVSLAACGSNGGGTTTAPSGDGAAAKHSVGIIQFAQHQALDAATEGFQQALYDRLGEANVNISLQNSSGEQNNCGPIVTKFVSDKVDLIMANATAPLQAAAAATNEIPIVGTSITDYVAAGVIADAAAPGGNITGASDLAPIDQQVEFFLELCPDMTQVGILYCSSEANSKFQSDEAVKYFTAAGVNTAVFTFADSNDLQSVLSNMVGKVDGIYIPTDNTAADNMEIVKNVTLPAGTPVFCGEENMCSKGGLATLSISYYSMGYQAGEMAADILEGKGEPSTMAIQYAPDPVRKYNPEVADALGITIPEGVEAIG